MPPSLCVPRVALGDDGYTVARLLVGGWQLSRGHRAQTVDEDELFRDLARMARVGWTTFDCADIYVGVEELFGRFRQRHAEELSRDGIELQFHTKYVPDRDALASLDRASVEAIVDRSLSRLGVERLDLVQFAWWDYDVPGYVDVALWLTDLQRAGKIRLLGVTNFDVEHTREMLDAGAPLVCNQVQYSLLDRRPENGMVELAEERGMALLCYGALAGGFLSERWLGAPAPPEPLANRSLTKYRLIIDEFGGWERYQALLAVLGGIAQRLEVSVASVALRYVLERPRVAAAIVGTFHGRHHAANLAAVGFELSAADHRQIDAVLAHGDGPEGDVFGLERAPGGAHSAIMWTNLNRES